MKTFKQFLEEDGGAAVSAAPTNVTGGIAGTGGKAGEPGVKMPRKKPSIVLTKLPMTRGGCNG